MKGWLLVLGVSWLCCGLLMLKFHSEVVFVCFIVNYVHSGDSVSERKGFGRVYQWVVCSALALSFAVLLFAHLHISHICGVSRGEEMVGRRRNRVEKFRSHWWNGSDFLCPFLSLGVMRAEPSGFTTVCEWLCVHPGSLHSAQEAKVGLSCIQKAPHQEAFVGLPLTFCPHTRSWLPKTTAGS